MDGSTDAQVKEQHLQLDVLTASPYFAGFQPRAYSLYPARHYKPRQYLDEIGIEKIGEMVQHGMSLMEVSAILDVSSRVMRTWVQASKERLLELEQARAFAADEERAQAKRVLYDTRSFPDTARAKAIADFHQWTAERWNKELYGKSVKVDGNLSVGVSYEFNIGVPRTAVPEAVGQVLEGVFREAEKLPAPTEEEMEAVRMACAPSLDLRSDEERAEA